MIGLVLNILLALVWALLSGEFSLRELMVGFLIGFALIVVFPNALGATEYRRVSFAVLRFLFFFIKELTVANVQVALLALTPQPKLNPMIFKVNIVSHDELTLTLFVAMVNLMPGTVVLGFSPNRRTMYVHAIGLADTAAARESILRIERAMQAFMPLPKESV